MPVEVTDLDGGLGNLIVGWGEVTEREYVEALTRHFKQDEDKFSKYRYSLSDYSAVTSVKVPTSAIAKMMRLATVPAASNPDAVVAIVAPHDLIYGLSRMSQKLLQWTSWETAVFRSRDDAEEWIRTRVEARYGIADLAMELNCQ
jgi:hypothetical protein